MDGDATWTVLDRRTPGQRQPVRGTQVGRFGIRMKRAGERMMSLRGVVDAPAFVIDHIPTGGTVGACATFADALMLADDLSRFAAEDPSSPDIAAANKQIGAELWAWVRHLGSTEGPAISFRAWRERRAA